jgi:GntR family transcriptional regulator, arabinose operon transcriptional repressor
MSAMTKKTLSVPGQNRSDTAHVVRALGDYCASLKPGDRIPTHTELMRQFQASERAVRFALDELQREGRIIRRNGVGTFVAERQVRSGGGTSGALSATPYVSNRTIVALTVPDNSFFDRCMDLLFRYAEAADLSLVCQPVNADALPSADFFTNASPLGFILFRHTLAPLAKQLQEKGCRVVLVGAPPIDVLPEVPTVYGDHEYGGYLAAKHLIDLGHRRIAFAHLGAGTLQQQLRWRGHQRAIQEARRTGQSIGDTVLSDEEANAWEENPARAKMFFTAPDAPTGIVAWNDHEAARLLSLLARAGIQVPQEVSLIGYDALPEGRLVYPPLTTIDHAMGQQLHAAVDLLTRPVPPPTTHTVIVTPTLVRRESTATPPAS